MPKFIKNSPNIENKFRKNAENSAPEVSVIIPAYNCGKFIAETLESALNQSFENFEIILINDGSPDSAQLEKALQPFLHKIVYIKQENGGASSARNAGIKAARGKLIAFLDGDDIWFPEKLKSQIDFLNKTGFEMVYCNAELFGKNFYKHKTFMESSPSAGEVGFDEKRSEKKFRKDEPDCLFFS